MAVREVLLLGNPQLYEMAASVERAELPELQGVIADLHDTLLDFRRRYGAGRAIAAPQIGVRKRLIYLHIDHPVVLINPHLEAQGADTMEVWDDCLCFPDLLVRVRRWRRCVVSFRNLRWEEEKWPVEGDLSELLQHEYDHLQGILAVARAIDAHSFALRSQRRLLPKE